MSIISKKVKYLIENDGVPTSGGILTSQMTKSSVIHVVEIAEEEMKQKAIEAFKSMTDSSTDRMNEFIDKLNS